MAASGLRSGGSGQVGSYHVFLSFRGPDTRSTILGHLYEALSRVGIHTFVDNRELPAGAEIAPSLGNAIQDSRIAVILFSENYAASSWCLDELAKIMDCRKQGNIIAMPVFFRVEPREVRTPRESFKRALDAHEKKFGSDDVKRWREALLDASNLSGFHIDDKTDEAEVVRNIVWSVNALLDLVPLHVAKFPVGIETRVKKVKDLLKLESNNVLRLVLWGMGGIGKSSLSKAVFNDINHHFDGCAYMPNVRVESADPSIGLAGLQQKLLSEALRRKDVTVSSSDRGVNIIRDRLGQKKVLLLLDDVNKSEQLDALAGDLDWFGNGSRIIITARDKSFLRNFEDCIVHEIKELTNVEALQLFSQHASLHHNKEGIEQNVIDEFLHYAKGLPLALQLLGSMVCGQSRGDWISILKILSKSPSEDIDKVLRISFDELPKEAKQIFLDIACFFLGRAQSYIERVLNACGFQTSLGIKTLIDRSLIKVSKERQIVEMHDLVQLMGQNIVKEKYPGDPRRWSRLWIYEDVLQLLSSEDEDLSNSTDFVQGIVLWLPNPKSMCIKANVLTKLKKLRLLIMENVRHLGEPICFPGGLHWIEWPEYMAPTLEFSHVPENLVGIDLPRSYIKTLGKNFRDIRNLTHVNFSGCESLTETPDFSVSLNMKTLDISNCRSLVTVPDSVGYLDKLVCLSLYGCTNLMKLPQEQQWRNLQTLLLVGCPKLEKFPEIMCRMEFLDSLSLSESLIKELPASIENLVCMKQIDLRVCRNLVSIPGSIYNLQTLESLTLDGCTSLEKFPVYVGESIGSGGGSIGFPNLLTLSLSRCNILEVEFLGNINCFPKLVKLFLSENNNIAKIPPLGRLENLKELHLSKCRQLQDIPELPPNLSVLKANGCTSLRRIEALLGRISSFMEVDLSSCPELFRLGTAMASVLTLEEARKLRNADFVFTGSVMPDWLEQCHFPNSVPSRLQGQNSAVFLVHANAHGILEGILLCVSFGHQTKFTSGIACQVEISINGLTASITDRFFHAEESDVLWLSYHSGKRLQLQQLLNNDLNLLEVSFSCPSTGCIKGCGLRLVLEDEKDEMQIFHLEDQIENKHADLNMKHIVQLRGGIAKPIVAHENITARVGLQMLLD